ncbi:MAG: hypothetical protein KAJ14_07785 [Candidatus Omnitrophica bacterium]|nr:hypothetical protein [Candidatus Omnitrophota bacterium]
MNCFYHPDKVAIGICKCCNKGLCQKCAVDLGKGLACKNKHETQVSEIDMIIEKNSKIIKAAPKNSLIAPIFYLFMGIIFVIFGYMSRDGFLSMAFLMGIGFIGFSITIFIRVKDLFNNKKS